MSSPPPPALAPPEVDPVRDAGPHPPGRTAVWVIACAVAAALALASGWGAVGALTNVMGGRRQPDARTALGVTAGLAALAGWLGWRVRDRVAEIRPAAGAIALWAFAGVAAFLAAALLNIFAAYRSGEIEALFVLCFLGPALGAGLLAGAAGACGPPVYRRPLAQTAGWVGGCVLAALLTFGPAVGLSFLAGTALAGVPTLLVAGGGVLIVLVAAITAAVLWRHDELAQERLVRWGQIGFLSFAATAVLLVPLLAGMFAEASSQSEAAWFFTAFVVLPTLGCGAAALTGRWALRQANDCPTGAERRDDGAPLG